MWAEGWRVVDYEYAYTRTHAAATSEGAGPGWTLVPVADVNPKCTDLGMVRIQ